MRAMVINKITILDAVNKVNTMEWTNQKDGYNSLRNANVFKDYYGSTNFINDVSTETIREYKIKTPLELINSDWEILKHLVKAGVGVAILSSICLEKDETSLVGIPLTQYFPDIKYGVITKKDRKLSKQAKDFIKLLLSDTTHHATNSPMQIENSVA